MCQRKPVGESPREPISVSCKDAPRRGGIPAALPRHEAQCRLDERAAIEHQEVSIPGSFLSGPFRAAAAGMPPLLGKVLRELPARLFFSLFCRCARPPVHCKMPLSVYSQKRHPPSASFSSLSFPSSPSPSPPRQSPIKRTSISSSWWGSPTWRVEERLQPMTRNRTRAC